MATTTDPADSSTVGTTTRLPASHRAIRRPGIGMWFFGLLIVVVAGGFAFDGWAMVTQFVLPAEEETGASTYTVKRGSLVITVTEDGNVESASNKEIKCPIEGGSTILWIVEDGKEVKANEKLVDLDKSSIEDKLRSQKIVYEKALSTKIQAEKDVEVSEKSIEEYQKGTFIQEQQDSEALITIALENLRSAENMLKHSEKMARKGFVTPLQLKADQFAVRRCHLELDSASTAKMVLEKYTMEKMLIDLRSKLATAKAKLRAEEAALELEKGRLDRLEKQLSKCLIIAPQDGMVVYANERSRRSSTPSVQVEEGAMVRERQTILRLPDLKNMLVKVKVHESKVEQIDPGMPAKIMIGDQEYQGKVTAIANQPEPGSWMRANVNEYATVVKIEGEQKDLKPGMSAEVTIFVNSLEDVLVVPVQCVVEIAGKFYCWLQTSDGPQRKLLKLGLSNDTYIEIQDGLKDGDKVLLNPRTFVPEASEEQQTAVDEEDSDLQKYGSSLKEYKKGKSSGEQKGDGASPKKSGKKVGPPT